MIIQIVTTEERVYNIVLFLSYAREIAGRAGRVRRVHAKESFICLQRGTKGGKEEYGWGGGSRIISACGTSALDG